MDSSGTCRALVGALLAAAPAALLSQPVYRCGNLYSQTPCANAVVVRTDDPRSPDQKAQTDAATLLAARLAERMQRDRLASEQGHGLATQRPAREKSATQPSASRPAAGRSPGTEAGYRP